MHERPVTNNPVIGIEARRSRITERLIECETTPPPDDTARRGGQVAQLCARAQIALAYRLITPTALMN